MIKGTFVILPPFVLTITDGFHNPISSAWQSCIFPVAKYQSVIIFIILLVTLYLWTDRVIPVCWGHYCIPQFNHKFDAHLI